MRPVHAVRGLPPCACPGQFASTERHVPAQGQRDAVRVDFGWLHWTVRRANHGCADAVGRQDLVAAVDAQLCDEDGEECLCLLGLAVFDDVIELVSDCAERSRVGCAGRVCG
jgi:hypothetical protein